MKIAIVNHEDPWNVLASTTLIKSLKNLHRNCSITYFVNKESYPVLSFNNNISVCIENIDNKFDLVYNLSPNFNSAEFSSLLSDNIIGFLPCDKSISFSDKEVENYYNILYGNSFSDKNILQLLFRFCGLVWRGEGYNLYYYPKNRTRKNSVGIYISNKGLRDFVQNNLSLSNLHVNIIPDRKNILKKMDEINRWAYIVTDDLFVLHSSIALRKDVEFLDVIGLKYKLEFFSKGHCYGISNALWGNLLQKV